MNFIQEYLTYLLGDKSVAKWAAVITFIIIGVIISLLLDSRKRNKTSINTPVHFSFKFLIQDNSIRLLSSIFITFTVVRFGEEMLGIKINEWYGLLLGLGFDRIVILIEKWRKRARDLVSSPFNKDEEDNDSKLE